MRGSLRTLKMDVLAVKPYGTKKNIAIFILFSSVFSMLTKRFEFPAVFAMTFSLMFMTYPFLMGEDFGVERMYRIMGIKNKVVVIGRYLYSMAVFFAFSTAAFVIMLMVQLAVEKTSNFAETFVISMSFLGIFLVFMNLNLPMFFALGYKKGKSAAAISLIVMMFIVIFLAGFFAAAYEKELNNLAGLIENNIFLTAFLLLLVFSSLTAMSMKLALHFYSKRDL